MKKPRNFLCSECNEVFERWVEDDVKVVEHDYPCCGLSIKQISAPKYFSNSTGRSPAASKGKLCLKN